MKVALVFPRFHEKYKKYMNMLEPPLGICYIIAILKKNNIDSKLFDGTFFTIDEIINQMKKYKPDIIGVSVNLVMTDDALIFAKKAKEVFKDVPIVFGGPQVTIIPDEILKHNYVDIVVVGEGEYTFLDLINNLYHLENVKGIYYKKNKKIIKNPPREFIKDLDSVPFPTRDVLHPQYFKNLEMIVVGSRGCIFNCAFCQPTLRKLFGLLRTRSPKNVVDEIEFLIKNYKTKFILFHDDTFTVNKNWGIEICKEIINRRLKIKWICNSRVNTIDKELLTWMKKAGCILLEFGVESGSDRIRNDILRKGTTKEQIENAFKLCHEIGIMTSSYLMIGSPEETKETIEETIELVKRIRPEEAIISFTTPMPGTYLYDMCLEKNLITAKEWRDYDFSDKITIKLKNLTDEDILNARNKIKSMVLRNYLFYCIRNRNFGELIKETFREPKRVPGVIKTLIKSFA